MIGRERTSGGHRTTSVGCAHPTLLPKIWGASAAVCRNTRVLKNSRHSQIRKSECFSRGASDYVVWTPHSADEQLVVKTTRDRNPTHLSVIAKERAAGRRRPAHAASKKHGLNRRLPARIRVS